MIAEKIIKIMSEIKPIEKTEVDEEKNFKFARAEDIISIVNPLLVKYKVIIVPSIVTNFIPQGNKVFITCKYQFIDVEAEKKDFIEVEIPGSGYDEKSGRAVYAAITGAFRYAMQQVFAIPIVDEIKNDNSNSESNNELDNSRKEQLNVNDTFNDDEMELNNLESISNEQLDELFSVKKAS